MSDPQKTKHPHRISRFHYTDLVCAGMNDPACQEVLDRMEANGGFDIVEHPKPGEFMPDYSINFLYLHKITVLELP